MSGDIYRDLRAKALRLDPAEVGITPGDAGGQVFGVVMDTGYAEGISTLVALGDGATSLYFSTGGGVIGGGEHEQVAEATRRLVSAAEASFGGMAPDDGEDLPATGEVIIRALGFEGTRATREPEDDLGYGRSALSGVFHAAHEVIGQLRMLEG